jgi:myo-inositol-1(or 4)-monophosphatase
VGARQNLADCVIATGMPYKGHGDHAAYRNELSAVLAEVAGVRRFGAASLDLAWVAAGRFDGFWEHNLSPWDMAAGLLLIREAGGFTTDLQGGDAIFETGGVVAGNEAIHGQLLALIRG